MTREANIATQEKAAGLINAGDVDAAAWLTPSPAPTRASSTASQPPANGSRCAACRSAGSGTARSWSVGAAPMNSASCSSSAASKPKGVLGKLAGKLAP